MKKGAVTDLAAASSGAWISQATTNHDKFPANNIINGDPDNYWVTGGLFPEQFVVTLPVQSNVDSVRIKCYNVKSIAVERCMTDMPSSFEEMVEKELPHSEGTCQMDLLSSEQVTARHLRFIIKSGYDYFCAVHQVIAMGTLKGDASKNSGGGGSGSHSNSGNNDMDAFGSSDRFKIQFRPNSIKMLPQVSGPERQSSSRERVIQTPYPHRDGGSDNAGKMHYQQRGTSGKPTTYDRSPSSRSRKDDEHRRPVTGREQILQQQGSSSVESVAERMVASPDRDDDAF